MIMIYQCVLNDNDVNILYYNYHHFFKILVCLLLLLLLWGRKNGLFMFVLLQLFRKRSQGEIVISDLLKTKTRLFFEQYFKNLHIPSMQSMHI